MRVTACLLALCLSIAPADARPRNPVACQEAPPPEPWTSWMQSGRAIAGGEAAAMPRLILGKPVIATLRPLSQVQFVAPPAEMEKKGYGGLFSLSVKVPARIGIGLSEPASVDVVTDRAVQSSSDHGDGPEGSGIAKIIWFDLSPGLHIVQIANARERAIRIMAADAQANRPDANQNK
ncbi:hypothetical protein BV98_003497 [Sphingobium herbicidovorans NBRC 16415]|uniref:Uncharacterized protein n=2 Tax=Sphingobium herbicidovorans TaxID=76947 RepID=A0A086P5J4_SPHHM|nr:hypothetical protein [Sphingobium herbicidovorans]KFG88662.1 hypothetical protein BV98_003497 [Sphingobium herbicidovorans NBRC 16415]